MRAQISFEYLVIVGIVLAVAVPALFVFFQQADMSDERVVQGIAHDLSTGINSVYVNERWQTVQVRFPEGFRHLSIEGNELSFDFMTGKGRTVLVLFSNVPLRPNNASLDRIRAGSYSLRLESRGEYVCVALEGDPCP